MGECFMGLDVGAKRIGVAVTDAAGSIAYPECVIHRKKDDEVFRRIAVMASERGISTVVVGLPVNMDGTCGEKADEVKAFAKALAQRTSLKVRFWDERLTTREAEQVLLDASVRRARRREVIDKMAAQLILQGFIDNERSRMRGIRDA